jgi:hypothetical protein
MAQKALFTDDDGDIMWIEKIKDNFGLPQKWNGDIEIDLRKEWGRAVAQAVFF